jgi:hypothetical protein
MGATSSKLAVDSNANNKQTQGKNDNCFGLRLGGIFLHMDNVKDLIVSRTRSQIALINAALNTCAS